MECNLFDFFEQIREKALQAGMNPDDFDKLLADKLSSLDRIAQSRLEEEARAESFRELSADALAELSDDELYEAILARMEHKKTYNYIQQIFWVVSDYEMEMQNGGLRQYFVNAASGNAYMLEEALKEIGKEEHCSYFHSFVTANGIDVNDLSSFKLDFSGTGMQNTQKRWLSSPLMPTTTAFTRCQTCFLLCFPVFGRTSLSFNVILH